MNSPQSDHSAARCRGCGGAVVHVGDKNGWPVGRCPDCGTVQAMRLPSAADLAAIYTNYVMTGSYTRKYASKTWRALRRVAAMRLTGGGGTFLDVGCNVGSTLRAARWLGFRAEGIDIDADALAIAREKLGPQGIAQAFPDEWAASGHTYDHIYCSEVIEHVPDPAGFARTLRALMKPGGLLFLTTPDAGHRKVPADILSWTDVKPPRHLTLFTQRALRGVMEGAGFGRIRFLAHAKPGIRMFARAEA